MVMSWPTMIACLGAQSLGTYQPIDAMLAASFAQITRVVSDFAVAIDSAALQPSLLDESGQAVEAESRNETRR